jgi:hypothetical protein
MDEGSPLSPLENCQSTRTAWRFAPAGTEVYPDALGQTS